MFCPVPVPPVLKICNAINATNRFFQCSEIQFPVYSEIKYAVYSEIPGNATPEIRGKYPETQHEAYSQNTWKRNSQNTRKIPGNHTITLPTKYIRNCLPRVYSEKKYRGMSTILFRYFSEYTPSIFRVYTVSRVCMLMQIYHPFKVVFL